MNACLACRRIKIRCRVSSNSSVCERCSRKSLECIFQKHRRARKPGTRTGNTTISTVPVSLQAEVTLPLDGACPNDTPGPNTSRSIGELASPGRDATERPPAISTDGLQPSGVLNHTAMSGRFSLRQILSTHDVEPLGSQKDASSFSSNDPIELRLVHYTIAHSLFGSFFTELNPYICQLDPYLHTFNYVRDRSSFLFTSILAVSSKFFNPSLHRGLYDHAQKLFTHAFQTGAKSAEVAQATLILTYWKEPQDTRAWTSLGYAIRLCMDMGWHRLTYSPELASPASNNRPREIRNIERTWYVLFVYDRSMSLQTGRPYMIERSAFIESVDLWCRDRLASDNDLLLASFVTLRLETADIFTMLRSEQKFAERQVIKVASSMLESLNKRIDRWKDRWSRAIQANTDDNGHRTCHHFLLAFYSAHAQLQLYTLPLQVIITSGDVEHSPGFEIMWSAFRNAQEMMHLIGQYSSCLYLAQDSIHVMTAYAAAFLVKLLFSVSPNLVEQIEDHVIESIRNTYSVFFKEQAPTGSSCTLQAKFLGKIYSDLAKRQLEANAVGGCTAAAQGPVDARDRTDGVATEDTSDVAILDFIGQEMPDFYLQSNDALDEWFRVAGFSMEGGYFITD
ncbi:fungal-specific transcription factor domain-containing protein [Stachybotrys elegans]|uniref:Fungal-specific transcription factor domain-containing protein n=1 Tax=Stachybotrys elegans TaxID=80388 RepID=A0A8K0SG74_9HYPO|nr:fungal-specific transcription factor domain-containing protein [Stachybotrys elegans]